MNVLNSVWRGCAAVMRMGSQHRATPAEIRQCILAALQDCHSHESDELRSLTRAARRVDDLWGLRVKLMHGLSLELGEQEATLRMNQITKLFARWNMSEL